MNKIVPLVACIGLIFAFTSSAIADDLHHYDPRCPTNRSPKKNDYDHSQVVNNGFSSYTMQYTCTYPVYPNRVNVVEGIWIGWRQKLPGQAADGRLVRRKITHLDAYVSNNKSGLGTPTASVQITIDPRDLVDGATYYFYTICNTTGGDNIRQIFKVKKNA